MKIIDHEEILFPHGLNTIEMKRYLFLLLVIFSSLHSFSQRPHWISQKPTEAENYYYRVTMAEAKTYKEAYAEAFAMAILESSWRLGVVVSKTDDLSAIKDDVMENIEVKPRNMNLPMNKVCEYEEIVPSGTKVRLYILWQVAKYGNKDPEFEEFNDCN